MAKALYVNAGETVDYTASGAKSEGNVVSLTNRIGICAADIANGDTGAVYVAGTWTLPANNNLVISQGDLVYWDVADDEINKSSSGNILAGWAAEAKAQTGTTVKVKLLG